MELKNYFKIPLKKANWKTSITEVKYIWADWKEYIWLEFEWYASTSELDRWWDVTLPTSFNDTLKSFMENAMMLLQHDDNKPIWNYTEVNVDNNWLYVKWLVKVDIDNVFQKLRTWVLKTMSIWYRILDYAIETVMVWAEEVDAFVIKQLELFEISLVSVPMCAWAQIKSLDWLSDNEIKSLYDVDKEDVYTFSNSIKDLSNKVKNFNTNNNIMNKDKKKDVSDSELEEKETIEVNNEEKKEDIVDETDDNKEEEEKTDEEIEEKEAIKEEKKIDWEEDMENKLKNALEEKFITNEDNESIWVVEFTTDKIVYNYYWFWTDYFDKYMKVLYTMNWDEILLWEPIEVESERVWVEKTKEFKENIKVKEVKKEETKEDEEKIEKKEDIEEKEEEIKKAPEKQAWKTAGENKKSAKDFDFSKKDFDNLVKESVSKIEKSFEEHKEITSKEVKEMFELAKVNLTKEMDDFAWILVDTLKVLQETNEKAQSYISKIENAPIVKTYRYQEANQKKENPLTNLIKQIKR